MNSSKDFSKDFMSQRSNTQTNDSDDLQLKYNRAKQLSEFFEQKY